MKVYRGQHDRMFLLAAKGHVPRGRMSLELEQERPECRASRQRLSLRASARLDEQRQRIPSLRCWSILLGEVSDFSDLLGSQTEYNLVWR